MKRFYIYDLETLFNFFSFSGKFEGDGTVHRFEISDRVNQRDALLAHLTFLKEQNVITVGYNNLGFDYNFIHELMLNPYTFTYTKAYQMCQLIINNHSDVKQVVQFRDRLIPQLDLVKLNHFDNKAKRTRLKDLQFAMRSESVEDMPVPLGVPISHEQMDKVLSYNAHDITETELFLARCKPAIQMRQELIDNGVLSGDVLNYSDVKIGTEYLIKKIGRSKCFVEGSKPRQSIRYDIVFKDIILPKIQYKTEEFNNVLEWFKQQSIVIAGEERPKHEVKLAGLDFHFGVGGVHASVENKTYRSNDTHVIKDIDVSGMYVAVAIANGFYPEHLGTDFVTAYKGLQRDRAQYPKGSTMNALLKLAGNGVYGNSNNPYSCFYDPKYTFSVTINGQLQLLQLVEHLSLIPGLEIIQANTDGITAYIPRDLEPLFIMWRSVWEQDTGLKLEEDTYSIMCIGDVNNYIAVNEKGKVKRKGRYWYPTSDKDYDGVWNKDFSNMTAQKGIEQVLLKGYRPEEIIYLMNDPFDFMLRYKTTGDAKVYIGDKEVQRTVRYYVSKAGQPMKKVAPPKGKVGEYKRKNGLKDSLYKQISESIPAGTWDARIHTANKSKYQEVVTSIESGRLVKECNNYRDFNWSDVDYEYYVEEIRKLII